MIAYSVGTKAMNYRPNFSSLNLKAVIAASLVTNLFDLIVELRFELLRTQFRN